MITLNTHQKALFLGLLIALGTGCGSDSNSDDNSTETEETTTEDDWSDDAATDVDQLAVNIDNFESGALLSDATIVDCTLSGGTETTCYQIEIAGEPTTREIGPFCPSDIYTDAEDAGIWFDGSGEVWDIDGDFITSLANLYGDSNWLLYDTASGIVNVTDTQVACEAAARPNVDPEYQNHCVYCELEYYGGGVSQTILLPTTPVPASSTTGITGDNVGVALDGVVLAPPAPVRDILSAYTIAAFDDCGGHVNPIEGYHYHASLSCAQQDFDSDGHSGLMAYAMDGYGIYGITDSAGNESTDLDECRGHITDTLGYHYHAASAAENMFVGCFAGELGGTQ